MQIKVIQAEDQYIEYLRQIERIIKKADGATSDEIDHLKLLTVVVEAYENGKYPIDPVDPIEAIKFRLHEKGMKQSDLVPYIGTSGRVSEILSKKRPLTVPMIRALSQALGISADVLISEVPDNVGAPEINWSKFPIKEILGRGWLGDLEKVSKSSVERTIQEFIFSSGLQAQHANFRRTLSGDADSPTTTYALYAWLARVIQRAREQWGDLPSFNRDLIDKDFMRELAQLSWLASGPNLAVEFLKKSGIAVVFEPHLKGTNLDGAALLDSNNRPIVALTLRYDRVDNFWFTLLHEVAHVGFHLREDDVAFVDDTTRLSTDKVEAEANKIAAESFIPRLVWKRSNAYLRPTRSSVDELARELRIHPAIIVGRIQRERGDYAILRELLGQNEVKRTLSM